MADYGAGVADDAIDKTARQLRRIYKKASEELQGKFDDFLRKHQAKGAAMFEKLQNGEITQAAYHSWMRGQVFIGKQWEQKIDQAARIMGSATAEAAEIVNHNRLHVFAENYNYAAYQLEKRAKGAISFNLFNDRAVARLMKKKPKMLPEWKIDEEKDYRWNRQKVENAVTQGIIQGKKIDDITGDMCQALQTGNESRMRTFARTSMTGAQNAGRLAQMEDAEEQGIKVKKRWIATLDSRTRDTHQELDGQTVPIDEPFEVDGMEIMYPGDPNAEPELVYNCRCTMIEIYEGIDRVSSRRAYDDDENGERDTANSYVVQDMTYKEWKEWKEAGKPDVMPVAEEPKPEPKEEEKQKILTIDDAKLIEQERQEHEERARRLSELEEERKKTKQEMYEASGDESSARRDYFRGDITEDEWNERQRKAQEKYNDAYRRNREIYTQQTELREEAMQSFGSSAIIDTAQANGVEYRPPEIRSKPLSTDEIVARLGGGDMTKGSCASLGFCYIGQEEGIDVIDFRGGNSRTIFARNARALVRSIAKEMGQPVLEEATKTGTGGAIRLARQMQEGRQYYFITGKHAAIMRMREGVVEFMELQSPTGSGWQTMGKADDRSALDSVFRWRFGSSNGISGEAMMMDIEHMKGSQILHRAFGYMNTALDAQKKGASGRVK